MSELNNPVRMGNIKESIIINPDDPMYVNFLEWQKLKKSSP